jgi:hypothetical protein
MSAMRVAICTLALLALAPRADAQVVIGGGVVFGYGVYPARPGALLPIHPYGGYLWSPYGGELLPDPLRFEEGLPSCYRFGRCTVRDLELFRDRPHRLERLAPAAPSGATRVERYGRADVTPTPEENIRPEYRGASLPREEFREVGRPREGVPESRR